MQNISESLKRQREQILTDHSEEMLSRHTSLIEIAIISLHNRMANRLNVDAEQIRSSGAVFAIGAFGRGLLGPNQAIPILLLTSESSPWQESWMDEIASPLTDAGWTTDVQQNSMELLLDRAREDYDFFLSLLESRYISGNRQLAERLDKALDVFIEGQQNALLDTLFGFVKARRARLEDPTNWLEPDLDHGPGGLSEITAIRAACRIASNIRNLEDAIFGGYLTRQEVDLLQQAEKTYARLLNMLRTLAGGSGHSLSALGLAEQESLADKLGYQARSGFLPVEAFMQSVYQLLLGVLSVSEEFWERLLEGREEHVERDEAVLPLLETGVLVRSGRLHIQTDRYPAEAGRIVHLFVLAARHKMGLANVTRQWISHHQNALDTAAGDQSVREELMALIREDSPELPSVRAFYNHGLMNSLIPELSAIHGLVQHDAFHLYPVQEHHFRTLTELKKIFLGDYQKVEPELTRIARNIDDPTLLYLAGLLHDIGKSSGRSHAVRGGEMIPAVARRLGLDSEESELLQFLVAQHLLLMDNASMRDLGDEEMVANCASIIGTSRRLDLLALLSLADMVATGPKACQKWRDTPVVALYERIHHLLEKGEPSPQAIAEWIAHIKSQVAMGVSDLMGMAELEDTFANLAPRYLLSMTPDAVAGHLRMVWRLHRSGEPLILEVAKVDGDAEITLVSRETTGMVYRSAGVLTLHGMDIRGAQAFAMNDGEIVLIFQCRFAGAMGGEPDWGAVKRDLNGLLLGKIALNYRIAAYTAGLDGVQSSLRKTPSQILVDNESNAKYTILEVYTLDRVGLLYTITRTLFELQIRIFVAKITTKVDQVADVFYIRTHQGEKVTDPEQIQEIRNSLLFWLDGPDSGNAQGDE
jgi:[protein-PII] uridylyltransferase